MRKIAIFASGFGDSADRVVSLFNDGDRIKVELLITDNVENTFTERFAGRGMTLLTVTDEMLANRPEEIMALLKEKEVELIAVDGFIPPLPELISNAYAGRIITLSNPAEAPREIVAAFSCDDSGEEEIKRPAVETPHKSVDEEWAERLKVNYDAGQLRTTPPPIPGARPDYRASEGKALKNPYGMPNYAQNQYSSVNPSQAQFNGVREPMPPSYLVWSVICTVLCCLVPGIVAIVFSSQVSSRYFSGDIEGARRASRNAEIWIIVSFVLGVLSATLYLPIMLIS